MKFVVIELQTMQDGTVANIVTSYDAIENAQSAYYTVLASAAISSLPCHAAMLVNSEGREIHSERFKRESAE